MKWTSPPMNWMALVFRGQFEAYETPKANPGLGTHEMGIARMGRDLKTSVLNKWNQVHAVKNVFITDGSCMTPAACQNPNLTYMALTAGAADYAVIQLKRNEIVKK